MKQSIKSAILLSTRDRIACQPSMSEQRYARNALGKAVGVHSTDITKVDLAGALFLACELHALNEREVYFYQLWREVRVSANKLDGKDAGFCSWLDNKSKQWHVELLNTMLGIEKPVEVEVKTTKTKINESDWV